MTREFRIVRPLAAATAVFATIMLVCSATLAADTAWTRDDAAHLLRRAGFGGTPTQIDRVFALGRDGAVDYLITGKLPAGTESPFTHVNLPAFVLDPEFDYRVQGAGAQYELQSLRAWSLDCAVRSDRPLDEKMTLFWHGVFTSGYREVRNVEWIVDQDALLHREALGNYKRLTREIIHDAAMIKYLNNDDNQKGRPNENLARELMELFTMGQDNGYTEKDIPEVARALTGMTVRRGYDRAQFVERLHDDGPKTIFGKTGNFKPDDVVDLIFDRPEPASYLAKRLWQFFGMQNPSPQDIALVADALRNNNWDIAPALRALFTSPSFYGEQVKFAMIKSPVELEAMTLRLLEEPTEPRVLTASAFALRPLGEELFQPPNVKGWPGGEHWITSTAIFLRYNLASGMANGGLGANIGGRFGGNRANKSAVAPAPATQPAEVPALGKNKSADPTNGLTDAQSARRARVEEIRKQEQEKVRAKVAAIPPLPPADQMVVATKLFPQLAGETTPEQIVDAAIARFVQHPLPAEKKAALVQAIGTAPLKLGEESADRRVRQMIGLLLSTPEYQVE